MNLNLARKWRSTTFDTLVGQEITVRMLKNSLYLQHYFPVYLFSGQRGCGKTSTARIFAAAINCQQLVQFQQDPKNFSIPCLQCESCKAMARGNHPDFIEIDAASHTGVDNVRSIIEAASLLPILGTKKIYLIDEAHMLSKAAFNAFLKILEEPPKSVLFILATTDPHKIIETVRSRCFQLFFQPVQVESLVSHLKNVCHQENVDYEDAALAVIVKQAQGSVRDALNIIEQIRFAFKKITLSAVSSVTGSFDDQQLITLLEKIYTGSMQEVLQWFEQTSLGTYAIEKIWYSFLDLMQSLVSYKAGLEPRKYSQYAQQLRAIVVDHSLGSILADMQLFYDHELLFLKTAHQQQLFETLVLRITQRSMHGSLKNTTVRTTPSQTTSIIPELSRSGATTPSFDTPQDLQQWTSFIKEIESVEDPLLISIFKQGVFKKIDKTTGSLEVHFSKNFSFFKEWLDNTKAVWNPLLHKTYGNQIVLQPLFIHDDASVKSSAVGENLSQEKKTIRSSEQITTTKPGPVKPTPPAYFAKKKVHERVAGTTLRVSSINVSDDTVWKKTNMLLKFFPGTVSEVHEQ